MPGPSSEASGSGRTGIQAAPTPIIAAVGRDRDTASRAGGLVQAAEQPRGERTRILRPRYHTDSLGARCRTICRFQSHLRKLSAVLLIQNLSDLEQLASMTENNAQLNEMNRSLKTRLVADKWSNYRKGVSTVVVKGTSTSDVLLLLKTGSDHMLRWKTG
jgi:hypothetical protein